MQRTGIFGNIPAKGKVLILSTHSKTEEMFLTTTLGGSGLQAEGLAKCSLQQDPSYYCFRDSIWKTKFISCLPVLHNTAPGIFYLQQTAHLFKKTIRITILPFHFIDVDKFIIHDLH